MGSLTSDLTDFPGIHNLLYSDDKNIFSNSSRYMESKTIDKTSVEKCVKEKHLSIKAVVILSLMRHTCQVLDMEHKF